MAKNKHQEIDESEWSPRKWIIPPGLKSKFDRFDMRCDLIIEKFVKGRSRPLIIHGPTGVGKSMFAEYFVYKFQKLTNNKSVFIINCAAIPETLLESELFGYKKGAASGADCDKDGYFKLIGEGVIVLEEVGELSKPLQAKLLIVIENRKFARLGDTEALPFKAQVIATTNAGKDDKFRDDFWYRFEIFSVPPIHRRRGDVLYYINMFDPELLNILTKGAVLALLAYNWPGNVREIERVCNYIGESLRMHKVVSARFRGMHPTAFDQMLGDSQKLIMELDDDVSGFVLDKLQDLKSEMERQGVNLSIIETMLNSNELSLDAYGEQFLATGKSLEVVDNYIDGNTSFRNTKISEFELAYYGFLLFCKVFFQYGDKDSDVLDMSESTTYTSSPRKNKFKGVIELGPSLKADFGIPFKYNDIPHQDKKIKTMCFCSACESAYLSTVEDVEFWPDEFKIYLCEGIKYLTRIKSVDVNDIDNLRVFYEKHPTNKFLRSYFGEESGVEGQDEVQIEHVTLDDLKELYYETVCSVIGTGHGYKKKLAEIADRTPGLITQDFEKLGLNRKFSILNIEPKKRLLILK